MKEEFLESVRELHKSMSKLNELWNRMDWSRVPPQVAESYPFHVEPGTMIMEIEKWMEMIKNS